MAPMRVPRAVHCSFTLQGQLHVLGGVTTGGVLTDALEVFDDDINDWRTLQPMPQGGRLGMTCTALNATHVLVVGGLSGSPWTVQPRVEMYDASQDLWVSATGLPDMVGHGCC